jgi:mannan endo-1,4-beta-mannosidase
VGGGGPASRAPGDGGGGGEDRPFIIHGFNTFWLMSFVADEATRTRVTAALPEAASTGLNV